MLARLTLTDFRNHRALELAPGPGFVCLFGDNGAGKTNILEAVSMLAPGRGLRGAPLSEMARGDGPGGWTVSAHLSPLPLAGGAGGGPSPPKSFALSEVEGPSRPTPLGTNGALAETSGSTLGTGTLPTAPERRVVRINGAPAAVNSFAEWLAILWLTPAMDRLFTGPAGDRRRFLDRLVLALEPGHAHHAARYEAAMRARNKLLAEPDGADPDWLSALEAGMAEHGTALGDARRRTVAALAEALGEAPDDLFPSAAIRIEGDDARDLAAALRAGRGRDAAAGRALDGPHRQDLLVRHRAKDQPAARCSTGEQKALLLGLALAHADLVASRRGSPPILLLDEVAAHLDPSRRLALFDRLAGRGQTWMTATEAALFDGLGQATMVPVTP